jgi:hypothetical protein
MSESKKTKQSKSGWDFPKKRALQAKMLGISAVSVERLVELKLKLEEMKPLYAQYDELLQEVLNAGKLTKPREVKTVNGKFVIELVDLFAMKNTAWKSVAQRRFDIALSRQRKV